MEKSRVVRFVGGPLDGESREVPDGRDRYEVSPASAEALGRAMRGEEGDSVAALPTKALVYVRLKDGRYYLSIEQPATVADMPTGFEAEWFDAGDDMLLAEIHGPVSDWGHAYAQVRASIDFLADRKATMDGRFVFNEALSIIERKERKAARRMKAEDLLALAASIESGTKKAKSLGNRRIIAAILREYSDRARTS